MDRAAEEKSFARLSGLLRAFEKSFVGEIGVDAEGLVTDAKVGEVLAGLHDLIAASERIERVVDELEWGSPAGYRALERAEAEAAGMK
jgi:hypothetical protein